MPRYFARRNSLLLARPLSCRPAAPTAPWLANCRSALPLELPMLASLQAFAGRIRILAEHPRHVQIVGRHEKLPAHPALPDTYLLPSTRTQSAGPCSPAMCERTYRHARSRSWRSQILPAPRASRENLESVPSPHQRLAD